MKSLRTGPALALSALALSLALGPASAGAQSPDPEAMIARIVAGGAPDSANALAALSLDELMAELGVPGVSVAVIHDFRIHWARGWGVADVETGAPVDAETLFQAASISKPVAAMGSLKAVQDGLFGLDDDINDILTSWQLDGGEFTAATPVTPRTLMSHVSGLGDAFGFPGYDPGTPIPTTVQIFEGREPSNVGRLFMERRPWQAFEYSGGGVTLMQQALEDARGRPFADVLRDDVLVPLGMTRSTYVQPLPPELDANAARGHDAQGASRGPKWHVYPEQAAAGLWTTPTDLARFAIAVQLAVRGESNPVLTRATAREMITPVGVGDFAVGFGLAKRGEGWYFEHGGSNWGFRGNLVAHTVKGYGLAVMTNADRGGAIAAELGRRIQVVYEWDSMAPPVPRGYAPPVERTAVDLPADVLARYVGAYEVGGGLGTLVIALGEQGLTATADGQGPFPVFAESETSFFLRVAPVVFEFEIGSDGTVVAVTVRQGGQVRRGLKVG